MGLVLERYRVPRGPVRLLFWLALVPSAVAAQAGSPAGPVPVEQLTIRRANLLRAIGSGVAVIRSAEERPIGAYAQDSDYRESSDFFYLTGLEAPDSWLVLHASREGPDRVVLYLQPRDPRTEAWTGPKLGPGQEAVQRTGIAEVRPVARLAEDLRSLSETAADTVWTLLHRAIGTECAGLPVRSGRCAPALRGLDVSEQASLRDLRPALTRLRAVKDEDEQRRLRRAIAITTEAHLQALTGLRPGLWEYELEAVIEYTFRRSGAERVGFPSIIGSGPNSTVLHYDDNRRRMEAGDLVVVDIGAEYGYYTADVTRTYPVSGTFTPRQRALYELVLGAQQAALDAVRPGVTFGDLMRTAQEYMRSRSGQLCGPKTCDHFFVHGLSHHIGLDVHDPGPGGALRPGMVFTIEPGIYLPDENLGIRIEDDVLVTASGHELLSAAAPRRAADVERAMAAAVRRNAEPARNH